MSQLNKIMSQVLDSPVNAGKTQKLCPASALNDSNTTRTQRIDRTILQTGTIAADSHPGFCRSSNEDSFGYFSSPSNKYVMLAVADGIGGHGNGEFASSLLIRMLLAFWRDYYKRIPDNHETIMRDLYNAVFNINNQIYDLNIAAENKMPMGTTLAALFIVPGYAITVHLGDSRVYLVRNRKVARLTQDHSYITEFLKNGTLSPDKVADHPLAHVILRSVGPVKDIEPEVHAWERLAGDRFMVCSDGLTEHLSDLAILNTVSGGTAPGEVVRSLIHATLRDGAKDNVTVLCTFQ